MITTPWDMMANQIIEESRGKDKHGSCGLGIFETIKRYKAGVINVDFSIRDYYIKQFEKEKISLSGKSYFLTMEFFIIFGTTGIL